MSGALEAAGPGARPRRAAVFAVLAAMAAVVLDAGAANAGLPAIAEALGIAPAQAVLVMTAYQVGVMVALLPSGALGERFGQRRVFAGGLAAFLAAAILASLAPSLAGLAAARFVQGLGGGAVMALGIALLRRAVSDGRLGAAIGWNALTVALASAAAPGLGGLVLALAGWRGLFLATAPVCAAALLAVRALPVGRAGRPLDGRGLDGAAVEGRGLDAVSLALNTAAFGLAALATSLGAAAPAPALAAGLAASAAGLLLVRREAPKAAPLLPLDLLRRPRFATAVVASIGCFAGQTVALVALPFHLRHALHQTPLAAGLYLAAWPLGVAAAATVAGRLADRAPAAWLCAAGAAVLAASLATTAGLSPQAGPAPLFLLLALCGAGFGLFQTPNNRTLFLAAPLARSGAAGGMQGLARLTGQTAGAILTAGLLTRYGPAEGPRAGFLLGAGLCLAAGLVSLRNAGPARPAATELRTVP